MLKTRKEKNGKSDTLTEYIRKKIVSGEWKPGFRLPTRREFQKEFGSSNLVNHAFQDLLDEGFLIAAPSRQGGTIVNPEPPHLKRYAVLLNGTENEMGFHTRAVYEAAQILKREGRDIRIHFDLSREFDDPDHLALYRTIERHGFAGCYLENPFQPIQRSRLDEQTQIPLAGMTTYPDGPMNQAHIKIQVPGNISSTDFTFSKIAGFGIRKLAILFPGNAPDPQSRKEYTASAAKYGIEIPGEWFMECTEYFYAHSASLIQLLLSPNNREFPDAIYVNNDNCLPYVMDVFQKMSGHREIRRIKIFSVGNAPYLPQFNHEIHYFAYDHLSALRKGLEFIDSWRQGRIHSVQKIPLRIEYNPPQKGKG